MKYLKTILSLFILGFCYSKAEASNNPQPVTITPSVIVSSVSVSGGQAQVLVTSPTTTSPFSTGYSNYITNIHIEYYAAGTLTGGSTPVTCTTTNLPSGMVLKFPTAEATGTEAVTDMQFANPLQVNSGSQFTLTCPGTASVIWNVEVGYFTAP